MAHNTKTTETSRALKEAIERERATQTGLHKGYVNLLAQIYAFEHGLGDAPYIDDFVLWRATVESRRANQQFKP